MTSARGAKTFLRRRTFLATAIVVIGLAGATGVSAHADPVDLQVVDRETGRPLRVWRHEGRLFIAGPPGDRYSLRVSNHTEGRVLVVLSVDGVNIITGETASYDQRGYIFEAHESYDLSGWRKSTTEVADFTFTRLSQSYAARTGRPSNVGVIGVAVFNERVAPEAAESAAPAPPLNDDFQRGAADRTKPRSVPPRLALREPPEPPPPLNAAPASGANQPQSLTGGVDRGAADKTQDITVTAERREKRVASVPITISAFTSEKRDVVAAQPRDEKLGTGHGAREYSEMTIEP